MMTDQTLAERAEQAPVHRYDATFANQIEVAWQARWEADGTFNVPNPGDPNFEASRPKFYCLDMFPYPSGAGLHVGHPEGYIATDIVSRFKRMNGFNVLHPMGFDSFGLPAEQYAVRTGVHPRETTVKAMDTFRRQLKRFGFCYDWTREISTCDESFYRFTQWIWLQAWDSWFDGSLQRARPICELETGLADGSIILNDERDQPIDFAQLDDDEKQMVVDSRRLAYLGKQSVNWCPQLGTVLANEEVIDGRSERGGHPVNRIMLKQWMFRITAYADRLLEDLAFVHWPESTRTMQREWIGRSEGATIRFPIVGQDNETIEIFTTRPDTIFGATYMVLAPEHDLVAAAVNDAGAGQLADYVEAARNRADIDRMSDSKEKTGVDTGLRAINPATGESIPVWAADYVLMGYGTGAIMAVPAHDERDFDFARTFDLPITQVVAASVDTADAGTDQWDQALVVDGFVVNSTCETFTIDGLSTHDAKARTIEWLENEKHGARRVNFRLRDWLFSRQRYWGEPFPIVHDESGRPFPVMSSALPVTLPKLEDYKPVISDEPKPPLARASEWVNTTAGEAGVDPKLLAPETPVRRETNTMPGWAGSCWYYLRFCDPSNTERLVGEDAERYWMLSERSDTKERTIAAGEDQFDATRYHVGGVDLYVGGAEHAVLHLLYARFWHKLLFDLGVVSTPEPIGKLFHQGMITSFAYKRPDGSLVPVDEVNAESANGPIEIATGEGVEQIVAKMSKSLHNVVNPDDVIAEYGADTMRLYEMYMGPLEASAPWNTRDIIGVHRFLQRVWRLAIDEATGELALRDTADEAIERQLHRAIAKVGADIERLAFNTAIAAMIEFVNVATGVGLTRDQLERFVQILAPFVPHVAEELWQRLGRDGSVALVEWPEFAESMLVDEAVEVPVQILGKVRSRVMMPPDADDDAMQAAALADSRIAELLEGKTIRKVIVVKGRLVNIVAN